jgi:hypothetical protein
VRSSSYLVVIALVGRLGLCSPAIAAQDRVAELQAEFDRETNPVRKAKLIHKLGDAQFQEARRASDAGDYDAMAKWMESYRDNAKVALAALKLTHPDGERHPEGYKQMQIHVRKSLRALEDTILAAPESERPRLEAVRKDLIAVEDDLIRKLFPPPPDKAPTKEPAKPKENPQPLAQGGEP